MIPLQQLAREADPHNSKRHPAHNRRSGQQGQLHALTSSSSICTEQKMPAGECHPCSGISVASSDLIKKESNKQQTGKMTR